MTTPLPQVWTRKGIEKAANDPTTPSDWTAQDVRELRKFYSLTQADLGALLGISLRSVIRLEAKNELTRFERWAIDGLTYRLGRKAPAPDPLARPPLAKAEPFLPRDG